MLQANFMALCFMIPELLSIEVLHCWNMYFLSFLLQWPWSRSNDLYTHVRTSSVSPGDIPHVQKWTSHTSRLLKVIVLQHLVTRSHFWSWDKDGSHIVRPITAKNPVIPPNLMALCVIEAELWAINLLHCRNRDFRPFCSCDLDLMTFIYKPHLYSLEIHQVCKYKLLTSRLWKVIVWYTYIHTDTTEIIYDDGDNVSITENAIYCLSAVHIQVAVRPVNMHWWAKC